MCMICVIKKHVEGLPKGTVDLAICPEVYSILMGTVDNNLNFLGDKDPYGKGYVDTTHIHYKGVSIFPQEGGWEPSSIDIDAHVIDLEIVEQAVESKKFDLRDNKRVKKVNNALALRGLCYLLLIVFSVIFVIAIAIKLAILLI